ncbi:hypothetical protein BpHYR1_014865 [Brachionus plicatilis]|uniref:Uncharacterized protein n=1 Tax=Brachionus plicatilis TaxID=10195 RepID=A0A3M7PM66_BRAPC|nr:hypothetical protein BpHYR1_014865 [Brachionus plicatilis]
MDAYILYGFCEIQYKITEQNNKNQIRRKKFYNLLCYNVMPELKSGPTKTCSFELSSVLLITLKMMSKTKESKYYKFLKKENDSSNYTAKYLKSILINCAVTLQCLQKFY